MPQAVRAEVRRPSQIKSRFDAEKAVEVILYVANRVGDPGFHRLSKILYFADRDHLAKYGRFICDDSYVAMKHGPVPSGTYDIMKHVRGDGPPCLVPRAAKSFKVEDGKKVVPLKDADLDALSESEKECLDAAITKYGKMSFRKLTDISHDKAWEAADENELIGIKQIAATLPDAKHLLDYLANPCPD